MTYLVTGVAALLAAELMCRLPVTRTAETVLRMAKQSLSVISSSSISDHFKERAILGYALIILKNTLLLGGYFVVVLVPIAAVTFIPGRFFVAVVPFMFSPEGLLYMTVVATVYFIVRRRIV